MIDKDQMTVSFALKQIKIDQIIWENYVKVFTWKLVTFPLTDFALKLHFNCRLLDNGRPSDQSSTLYTLHL